MMTPMMTPVKTMVRILLPVGLSLLGACGDVPPPAPSAMPPTTGGSPSPETPPPQGNGVHGTLSFLQTRFGVGVDGELRVIRPVGTSCGPGCVHVDDVRVTAASASVDPPLADVSGPVFDDQGAALFLLHGRASGSATLRVQATAGGQDVSDSIKIQVVVADRFQLGCKLDGFSLADGLLVGAATECRLGALSGEVDIGSLVPTVQGGLQLGPAGAAGSFALTAVAPGNATLSAEAGGLGFQSNVAIVDENETFQIEMVDLATREAWPGTVRMAAGTTLSLRPRLITHDGRAALGLEDRFAGGPEGVIDSHLDAARHALLVHADGAGIGSLDGTVGGRRWEIPILVQ